MTDKPRRLVHVETYTAYSCKDKREWEVYLMSPEGEWDEFKWTEEEAKTRYPETEWEWIYV